MKNYFMYQYEDSVSSKQKISVTTVFIHQKKIYSQSVLSQEIDVFFQENNASDKLVVLLADYIDTDSLKYFSESRSITFARVPGKSSNFFNKNLLVYKFDSNGDLSLLFGEKPKNEKKFIIQLLRSGSTIIFKKNGGLVESTSDHHFVFPSNKHSSKFIRTGNVLINQPEILFLAFQLLSYTKNRDTIYCDTSSINVLPFAVFELLRRFGEPFECPTVNSFESYELFESSTESFSPDSLVLISASTSGNIIDRIVRENRADKSQIIVVYFLGSFESYQKHSSNILCNLTKDDNAFPLGESEFATYPNSSVCELCSSNSRPINIRSDVFLTIQPKVENHVLSTKTECTPEYVDSFVNQFKGNSESNSFIKVFYKEDDANADYEIYFDFMYLIDNIDGKFSRYRNSLNRYIDKYIPANIRYILHLPDAGSEKLAEYILSKLPDSIRPNLIKLDSSFVDNITESDGSVAIVASCITTGKKLLQISRLMRDRDNINLIYFVGLHRPSSERFSNVLINDLKKGKDKSDERPFIAVEKIICSTCKTNTSWYQEKLFFEEIIGNIDQDIDSDLYRFVDNRLNVLRNNKNSKGLSNEVFLKKYNNEKLYLRKNFAFWKFEYSHDTISQSEVYFTISSILTNLENNDFKSPPSLKQTNYVRNILSPRNFHRFNDGIIQAALLRAGKAEFFSYDLDGESNIQMKEFLLSIIDQYNSEDGEALLEFILAIGIKKLKLKKEDLKDVLIKAKNCDDKVIAGIAQYIYRVFDK